VQQYQTAKKIFFIYAEISHFVAVYWATESVNTVRSHL